MVDCSEDSILPSPSTVGETCNHTGDCSEDSILPGPLIVDEDLQSRRWFDVGEGVALPPNRLFAI